MKTILMSMRITEAQNYHEKRNSISFEYINFFEDLGFIIHLIPNNTKHLDKYFNTEIDLVVLSGGNNVNPKLYNSKIDLDDVYFQRDNLESKLIDHALKREIPILGICRGFHYINVFFDGSLAHNIQHHTNTSHLLQSDNILLKNKPSNSFHNHGIYINNLSKHFEILAKSGDLVEAYQCKSKHILGLQWHPERQAQEYDKKLISDFIKGNT